MLGIAAVGGIGKTVALVGVNDQLRGDVKVAQSMPEFKGLGRGTLAIAVAHDRKRGGGDVLNEGDGRTLGVDLGVVVYRGAEVGNHPLVNGVFAVVRKPVGDAGSGDGGPEAMGLGNGEHGHETAVAPAGDAHAVGVDGILGQNRVDPGQNVAEVAVAEVLAIGKGKGLALAEAAARVGHEDEVALGGIAGGAEASTPSIPAGGDIRGRTAMDLDNERVFLARIVVRGEEEPSLNVEIVVGPGERGGISPGGLEAVIEMRELDDAGGVGKCVGGVPGPQMRGTGGTHSLRRKRGHGGAGGVDLWRLVEGAGLKDEEGAIGSDGETAIEVADADRARVGEDWRGKARSDVCAGTVALELETDETVDAVCEFAGEDVLVIAPDDPLR